VYLVGDADLKGMGQVKCTRLILSL
jgi:hypothetical protein